MIHAPTREEWLYIYAVLGAVLLIASAIEIGTGKIPNQLTVALAVYLAVARGMIGPAAWWVYLLSFFFCMLLILAGFGAGVMGGGISKLTMAVSAGLPPWMTLAVGLAMLAAAWLIRAGESLWGRRSLPGSLLLGGLLSLAILAATQAGTPP